MRRIAIGDIHLSAYKDDPIGESNLPKRLHDLDIVLRKICDFATENNIGNIDILGDLNNDKDVIYTDAQNVFKDILMNYSDIEFLLISGNHDLSSTGEHQTSSVSAFEGYSNVTCITSLVQIDNLTIVPFSGTMIEELHECEPSDILLSHFGLSEGVLQSGISIITDIKLKDLAKYKLVLLGHYHKPQEISNPNTQLYYTGNLIHTTWNDKNETKRFLVYDTETLQVASIELSGFQEYREFIIEDEASVKKILDEADKARNEGHKVRIKKKFKGDIDSDLVIIDDTEVDVTQRGLSSTMTTDEKLKRYLEVKEIPEDEHEKYIEIAKRIIGKESQTVEKSVFTIE